MSQNNYSVAIFFPPRKTSYLTSSGPDEHGMYSFSDDIKKAHVFAADDMANLVEKTIKDIRAAYPNATINYFRI